MADDLFRVYWAVERDGYPKAWHREVKHLVREQAGHRCARCRHPYRSGEHGRGEWSPCDDLCAHQDDGPIRVVQNGELAGLYRAYNGGLDAARAGWVDTDEDLGDVSIEAQWRILTVHHLNGVKSDCRWWNLCALCQRCHLSIQSRVVMERIWPWPHSDWFKPHAAGWYADAYLNEALTREETLERLDELLALELSPA